MLRRDPTTIKLVPEDIKEFNREQTYKVLRADTDTGVNQNLDNSIDESYISNREQNIKDRVFGSTGSMPRSTGTARGSGVRIVSDTGSRMSTGSE